MATVAAALTFVLSLSAPITIDLGAGAAHLDIVGLKPALAKGGNGGGNGGGKGGGNGGGNGGGVDSMGNGNGNGALASAMGSLNAAHASAKAFEHASGNSRVGALADFKRALEEFSGSIDSLNEYLISLSEDGEPDPAILDSLEPADADAAVAAGDSLKDAANKVDKLDADVLDAVKGLLDGK